MGNWSSRSDDEVERDELADLVRALITASRALIGITAQSLLEVEDAITLSEFRALVVLTSQGAATTPALARRLGFGPDATARVAARLEDLDLVDRSEEGALRPTEEGSRLVSSVTARRSALVGDVAARMDRGDRQRVVDALLCFAEAAGEPIATDIVP